MRRRRTEEGDKVYEKVKEREGVGGKKERERE